MMSDEVWEKMYSQMQDQLKYSVEWSDSILKNIYGPPPYGQRMNLSTEDLLVEIGHLVHHNNKLLGIIAGLFLLDEVRKREKEKGSG